MKLRRLVPRRVSLCPASNNSGSEITLLKRKKEVLIGDKDNFFKNRKEGFRSLGEKILKGELS